MTTQQTITPKERAIQSCLETIARYTENQKRYCDDDYEYREYTDAINTLKDHVRWMETRPDEEWNDQDLDEELDDLESDDEYEELEDVHMDCEFCTGAVGYICHDCFAASRYDPANPVPTDWKSLPLFKGCVA